MQLTNKLILGTVQLGFHYGINNKDGKPDENEIDEILSFAELNQINLLDTAEGYGTSMAEISRYKQKNKTANFDVITKFSFAQEDENLSRLESRIQQVLNELQIDYLSCVHYHDFANFSSESAVFSNLIELKKKGYIKNIGLSLYNNQQFEKAVDIEEVTIIQLPFNILDNYSFRGSLLEKAKEKGKEIHTRSCYLQGLFFREYDLFPEKLKPLIPHIKKMNQIAVNHNIDLQTMCLNYCLSQKTIDKVIIGVETKKQLQENTTRISNNWDLSINDEISAIIVVDTELLNPALWNQ